MKKSLFLLLAALLPLWGFAAEQTVTWSVATAGLSDMTRPTTVTLAQGYTATFGGPSTGYSPIYSTYYGGLQFYAGSTLTLEGPAIRQVVLTYREGYAGSLTADCGTLNTNATNYTWVGSESKVVFTNSVQGLRLTDITLTYDDSADPGDDPGDDPDNPTYSDDVTTPATPAVDAFTNSLYGSTIAVTIPSVDVEGTALNPARLYYQILKDIEREVSPATICEVGDLELEEPIETDLVEIPFAYEDYYVEHQGTHKRLVYLENLTDLNSYNRIGVQTIYRTADAQLLSAIAWHDIKDYTDDDPGDDPVYDLDALVEVPEAADVESGWVLSGTISDGQDTYSESYAVQVAFDGQDVYIQGLSYWFDEAWVKGRLTDGTLTIPTGQYMGEDEDGPLYLLGLSELASTLVPQDIVFSYDAEARCFSQLTPYIGEASAREGAISEILFTVWSEATITEGEVPGHELVQLPEGAEPEEWLFAAYDPYYETTVTRPSQVAIVGTDVYVNGISEAQPSAWIVGTLEGNQVTFAAGQFLGQMDLSAYDYGMVNFFFSPDDDVVFGYDAEAGRLTSADGYVTFLEGLFEFDELQDVVITRVSDAAATPATPTVTAFNTELSDESYPYVEAVIPATGTEGEALAASRLFYAIMVKDAEGTEAPLTLSAVLYEALDEDLELVPYSFTDSYDILLNNETRRIYLNQPLTEITGWKNIGVRSVYTGGNETRFSATAWFYDNDDPDDPSGIAAPAAAERQVRYFDLQGRATTASAPGLKIRQTTTADGTVSTQKVAR